MFGIWKLDYQYIMVINLTSLTSMITFNTMESITSKNIPRSSRKLNKEVFFAESCVTL